MRLYGVGTMSANERAKTVLREILRMVNEHDLELDTIERLRKANQRLEQERDMANDILRETEHNLDTVIDQLRKENQTFRNAILQVPDFIRYPWDWMQCIFCGGKREHEPGCIRKELADAEK